MWRADRGRGYGRAGTGLTWLRPDRCSSTKDAPWIAFDLTALLERGEEADIVCWSDPIDSDRIGRRRSRRGTMAEPVWGDTDRARIERAIGAHLPDDYWALVNDAA